MSTAGRPRDPEIERRVLDVAWQLLTDEAGGYAALSFDAVRRATQVSRPALKLRWQSKAALAVDALTAHLPTVVAPDTGALRTDLAAAVAGVDELWSRPGSRRTFPALLADLQDEPVTYRKFRDLMLLRGASLELVLDRARRRGEVSGAADLHLVADLLEGPVLHRHLISDAPSDQRLLAAVLASVLDLLAGRLPVD